MEPALLPLTQWLAVTTHCGDTKEPPQKTYPVGDHLSIACHGQAPGGASSPPTIRVEGRKPHSPAGKLFILSAGVTTRLDVLDYFTIIAISF